MKNVYYINLEKRKKERFVIDLEKLNREIRTGNIISYTYLYLKDINKLLNCGADKVSIKGKIRSPYPGCNSCPHDSLFESEMKVARKLACHLHAERNSDLIKAGTCDAWTPFPIDEVENHLILENFHVVSNIPKDAVNTRKYSDEATIWERGGEA